MTIDVRGLLRLSTAVRKTLSGLGLARRCLLQPWSSLEPTPSSSRHLLGDIEPLQEPWGGIRGCGRPLVVVGGFLALLPFS